MFSKPRRALFMLVLFVVVACAVPAWASLPYYNQNLGYTIWLGDGWVEAPDALSRFSAYEDGLAAQSYGWEAAYALGESGGVRLLVSRLQGKMITRASIADFNRHVVRQLKKLSAYPPGHSNRSGVQLRRANFDSRKNMLRLEMDTFGPSGQQVRAVVYVVYTRGAMLKFVGLVPKGDVHGVSAVDKAVSSIYVDQGLSSLR